ncbi:Septum site-determining protein MinD (plasmid) [Rhodovastum atsumiense]|uniref:hypothetical protein n=1 Tax=Rhodovastum atsumiense TaxID=504468 RepID=UPI002024D928|nr:hypothetical protein [Rhodovastum atsumiense]CAH2606246.1 Septum site-determining protein MinD [Rhodovastum atsumiense]
MTGQTQPPHPRVTVTVSGTAGTGKSRVLANIEVALRACGYEVQWSRWQDQREVHKEHWTEANCPRPAPAQLPVVILAEQNERPKFWRAGNE